MNILKNKKILVGITASIAAYKIVHLVRLMVKQGVEVKVVITPAAAQFVSPLALATVSKNKVLANIADEESWNDHVHLGRWADVILIAPLSCNTLAKFASGICDNLLTAVVLSATCPVIVAPAMDEDMWKHASTKKNLKAITEYGYEVVPVVHGELASGLVGEGRMEEPENIITYLYKFFTRSSDLNNTSILITAGPTYEPIDPVRFIGNHSSGKMGVAIAQMAAKRGANVTLVLGPVQLKFDTNGISVINVQTAAEMFQAVVSRFDSIDVAIMSAAVADYTPATVANEKIKKQDGGMEISLLKTKDILKEIGLQKKSNQIVVGFALETNNEEAYAIKKLNEKKADLIVMNSTRNVGTTFGSDINKITIFGNNNLVIPFETKTKMEVANDIIDVILKIKNERI